MDVEKFIYLVHEHRCLWDHSDPSYHLRDHQRKSWREISEQMEMPVDELKRKWRGLRDTFGRELKKVSKVKSRQGANKKFDSKWHYFKDLLFLQDTMFQRKLTDETLYVEVPVGLNSDTTDMSSDDYAPSPSLKPDLSPRNPNKVFKTSLKQQLKKRIPNAIDAKLLQIEDKLKYLNDSDTQFLMSLRPCLKDIPKHRKLIIRTKLQQVLIDELDDIPSTARVEYYSDE